MIEKQFKGAVFDLDGTLLYTLEDIGEALNYALVACGIDPFDLVSVRNFTGSGARELVRRALRARAAFSDRETDVYNHYMNKYRDICLDHTRLYDGILKTIRLLKRHGIKTAVLSNKPQRDTETLITRFFGQNLFDVVIGAVEGVPLKPDPATLEETIAMLGLTKEETAYIGDSTVDVKTAQNAGVFGIFVCYGYESKKKLEEAGASVFMNSPAEILKYFIPRIDGILLVDKPAGMTSQSVVFNVKKKLGITKAGHAGTLDPAATGLLVVLLGDATKISSWLANEEKGYRAEITIGIGTDSLDREGKVTARKNVDPKEVNAATIDNLLASLPETIMLPIPMHSAVKVAGRKLCDLAREGKKIDVPDRACRIYRLRRESKPEYFTESGISLCRFYIECLVSKGTYIRSLANEIGRRLGYPAYLTALRRISSGKMTLEKAVPLADIKRDNLRIIGISDVTEAKNIAEIEPTLMHRIINGHSVKLPYREPLLFATYQKQLKAICKRDDDGSYHAIRVWRE